MAKSELTGLRFPRAIRALAESVQEAGGRAWIVGGSVRDHLLGKNVKDFDVEVHGVPAHDLERMLHRLGKVNAVGRSFGVFKLRPAGSSITFPEIDISIPRRDSNAGPGHKGIHVQGDPWMSLEEAVSRRDLTINALMVDILTLEMEDRVGGVADLKDGVLRAVDPHTFLDDPLRALRVVQFVSRTGFTPTPSLIELCRLAPLDELPPERVQMEWAKLMLKGTRMELALHIAREANILSRVFPERADPPELDAALQGAVGHREPLKADGPRWALMLSVWLSQTEPQALEPTLDRLCIYTCQRYPVRKQVLGLVSHLGAPTETDADLRHLSVHADLSLALALRAALQPMSAPWSDRLARAMQLGIAHEKPAMLLKGRDLATLGMRGGPQMGRLIEEAYQLQLDGELRTIEEALAWAKREIG